MERTYKTLAEQSKKGSVEMCSPIDGGLTEARFNEVAGALLGFHVHFADVLTDDGEANHPQATDEPETAGEGCPTVGGADAEVVINDPCYHQQADKENKYADGGNDAQRCHGE